MNSPAPSPTALIAEDEPLLAAALAAELARAWPELRIVATVGDGASAVEHALRLRPDVLFFDIRMPGLSGLDAAAELADAWDEAGDSPFPALVFVTAYDQYAVQAFEAQAADYLLKPVQPARLEKTVQKLRAALAHKASNATDSAASSGSEFAQTTAQLRQLMAALQHAAPAGIAPPLRQLQVSPAGSGGSVIRMLPLKDVLFLQAADKYVRVVTATGEHLLRTPLKDLAPQLDTTEFWQIHRSTLVRADAIECVQRDSAGRLQLRVRGVDEALAVSRLYAHLFKAM